MLVIYRKGDWDPNEESVKFIAIHTGRKIPYVFRTYESIRDLPAQGVVSEQWGSGEPLELISDVFISPIKAARNIFEFKECETYEEFMKCL